MQDNYKSNIDKLRRDRCVSRTAFKQINKEIELILNRFDADNGGDMITFDQMSMFNINKLYEVNEKVSIVKVFEDERMCVFDTFMKAGGTFGIQKHDVKEVVEVVKGHLITPLRGFNEYIKDEVVVFAPNEVHKPQSKIDSIYKVTFLK